MKIQDRVRAGMAYLDAVYGRGWRKKIILRKLDLSGSYSCPLGQTDGDYDAHRERLKLSNRTAFDLGFHISPNEEYDPEVGDKLYRMKWSRLTAAWKRALGS